MEQRVIMMSGLRNPTCSAIFLKEYALRNVILTHTSKEAMRLSKDKAVGIAQQLSKNLGCEFVTLKVF